MEENNEKKERSGFGKFLYAVFGHNVGYKFLAIGLGLVVWLLTEGL